MLFIRPHGQNTGVYKRMQRFYPAVKAFWVRCNVGYAYNVNSGVGQRFGSTSGGDYFEAQVLKPLCKFYYSGFVRYAYYSSLFHICSPSRAVLRRMFYYLVSKVILHKLLNLY